MAGNLDNIDIELFIAEVKNYPEIWNVAEESYHDRIKKRGAWISVCRVFSEKFDEMVDKDKNEICSKLIKKWRNIKDNYLKSLKKRTKSGQAAGSGRQYIYARQLSFMQTAGATTKTQSSLGDNDKEENLEQSEEQPRQILIKTKRSKKPSRKNQNVSKKHKRDIESTLIDFMKALIPSSVVAAVPEPNADRSFFESILPSISDFTEDQKLELRCEILNMIKRMRMFSRPQIYGYTPNIPNQNPTHPTPHFSNYLTHTSPQNNPCSHSKIISPSVSSLSSVDNQLQSEEDTLDLFSDEN